MRYVGGIAHGKPVEEWVAALESIEIHDIMPQHSYNRWWKELPVFTYRYEASKDGTRMELVAVERREGR